MIASPEEFIAAYAAATETAQWESVAPLIHEDCVVVFSSGTFKGKAEVEKAFRRTFDLIQDETYKVTDIHWIQRENHTTVFTYNFAWTGIINGESASGGGRGSSVLTWSDGVGWKLLCEHLGPPAP